MPHENSKGYAFNYLLDASHCYWAARLLELNYRSVDPKDKLLDELIIRRLRKIADDLVGQSVNGLKTDTQSVSEGLDLMKQLAGEQSK